ncbi:DUF1772 domain-containing protein [Alteromonas sediminis]|uniref:DUF1772 domain-containing protein n=1 Tax=Alteromonas sediminis TaxID=2259342 RepID=A0A3N5YAK7_9ALTE|nr:anthrone oxygenase family protein [Alteromonas sediminis]RPJ65835.1 DUF1772 domain-containing protein [Alteromonas sediminis]
MNVVETVMQLSMMSMIGMYGIFSNTIIKALTATSKGAAAMVEINQVILNPLFKVIFFGSALSALYFFIFKEGGLAVAGILFFVGTFMVTVVKNVPMNNRLKAASEQGDLETYWEEYASQWNRWNHVRTLSAFLSGALILMA